jgi:hypothetical protein
MSPTAFLDWAVERDHYMNKEAAGLLLRDILARLSSQSAIVLVL